MDGQLAQILWSENDRRNYDLNYFCQAEAEGNGRCPKTISAYARQNHKGLSIEDSSQTMVYLTLFVPFKGNNNLM